MSAGTVPQTWTILSLINWGMEYLKERNLENPRLNVELLLAHALNLTRVQLYTNFEQPLTREELAHFKYFFQRRIQNEPLQYILGETDFYGLKFFVDSRVLIPRPETEILVEEVLSICTTISENKTINILDIGTGSGNIAIALAKFCANVKVIAIDVSNDTLDVAKQNAKRNDVEDKIQFFQENILLSPTTNLQTQTFDVIVSNPPYISQREFEMLQPEIKNFEPHIATTDNADGYSFYHKIAEVGKNLLIENGIIFVEVAYNQSNEVKRIFSIAGYGNVRSIKDYNGHERVVVMHSRL
ncbi:MAG: peptide chain release factor N(5)-glutamine methyltransferase, partial [Ignavibacteriales bacterium]|nr:peptide chain release factor N(5)-glutamine methyltransferase [Ignavibacteriales bacterium]